MGIKTDEGNLRCSHCNGDVLNTSGTVRKHDKNFCSAECLYVWEDMNNDIITDVTCNHCAFCDGLIVKLPLYLHDNCFCSNKCLVQWENENIVKGDDKSCTGEINSCNWCFKDLTNVKIYISKEGKFFCNENCSTIYSLKNDNTMLRTKINELKTCELEKIKDLELQLKVAREFVIAEKTRNKELKDKIDLLVIDLDGVCEDKKILNDEINCYKLQINDLQTKIEIIKRIVNSIFD